MSNYDELDLDEFGLLDDIDVEALAELEGLDILLDEDIAAYTPKGRYGYNPDRLERYTNLEEDEDDEV